MITKKRFYQIDLELGVLVQGLKHASQIVEMLITISLKSSALPLSLHRSDRVSVYTVMMTREW